MFAAIPYFELRPWYVQLPLVGEVPLDFWAILVCIGFVVGLELARARAIKLGLDVRDVVDGAVFIVLSGFFWAHVVTLVAYHPERLAEQGVWALLRFWEGGFASFGGFLGAVIGAVLFYRVLRKRDFWRHADVIAFGFPFGWFFGRLGCGVVHDHIGRETNFFLAMDFDHGWWGGHPTVSGVRHELGLYEAAFMVLVSGLFLYLGRRDRVPGFFMGLFAVVYAPVRFFLDFLRNTDLQVADARYFGLTPAQYGALVMLLLGVAILYTRDWKGFVPLRLGGGPDPTPDPAGGEGGSG